MAPVKLFMLVITLLTINSTVLAEMKIPVKTEQNITIGKSYTIPSKVLNKTQRISVSLPQGYEHSEKRYSVIYLLDGKKFFAFGAALAERLNDVKRIPPSIIVAIDVHTQGRHLEVGLSEADRFLTFIEKEVMPFVDSQFRTNARRTLAGWQKGAGFTVHALIKRPDLFEGYIAATPYLSDDYQLDFTAIKEVLSQPNNEKYLYMGVTDGEFGYENVVKSLTSQLKAASIEGLVWDFHVASTKSDVMVEHQLSMYSTLPKGLIVQHAAFKNMRFDNAADFRAKGGMDYVNAYYAKKSLRYGGSSEIDAGGLWSLLRIAMEENNLPFFEELMQMKQKINSKTHVNWMLRYANFYQKHGESSKAIAYYQKTAALNPKSVKTLAGLAQTYVAAKQADSAKKTYVRAIELAKAQSHIELKSLQSKLALIK